MAGLISGYTCLADRTISDRIKLGLPGTAGNLPQETGGQGKTCCCHPNTLCHF